MSNNCEIALGTNLTKIDMLPILLWKAQARARFHHEEDARELVARLPNYRVDLVAWENALLDALTARAIYDEGLTSPLAVAVATYLQVREYVRAKTVTNEIRVLIEQGQSKESAVLNTVGGQPYFGRVSRAVIGEKIIFRNGKTTHTKNWEVATYLQHLE
jgi:hypothetical protein